MPLALVSVERAESREGPAGSWWGRAAPKIFFRKIELTKCKLKQKILMKLKHAVVKIKGRCMKDRKIITRKIKYAVEDKASLPPGEGKSYLWFGVSARRRLSGRLCCQTFLVATAFCF